MADARDVSAGASGSIKKRKRDETNNGVHATEGATPAKRSKKQKSVKSEPVNSADEAVAPRPKKSKASMTGGDATRNSAEPKSSKKPHSKGSSQRQQNPATSTTALPTDADLQTQSPFVQQTTSLYLALSPCANDFPLEGLCAEHISPLLLTYYPPLGGVVLSYSHPRLSEHPDEDLRLQAGTNREAQSVLARSIDEYAVTFVWLTAEFTLFKPKKGCVLEGYVNLQNESLLGLICYNYFNAAIERGRLPKDWRWVVDEGMEGKGKGRQEEGGEGYFADGEGKKVEGRFVFRVTDFEATGDAEAGGGSISLYGSLLSLGEEKRMEDEERQQKLVMRKAKA